MHVCSIFVIVQRNDNRSRQRILRSFLTSSIPRSCFGTPTHRNRTTIATAKRFDSLFLPTSFKFNIIIMGGKKRNRKEKRNEKNVVSRSESTDAKSPPFKKPHVTKPSNVNPLLTQQAQFLNRLSMQEKTNFFDDEQVDPDRRAEIWMEQADLGERLVRDYAWATPDDRALRVLRHFSPLIEIGCGSNAYWCKRMTQSGMDVIGFDIDPVQGGKIAANQKISAP